VARDEGWEPAMFAQWGESSPGVLSLEMSRAI
jgi:hypothetical protein